MIKKKTWLLAANNCGIWLVKTFHLYKGFSRKTAFIGDFVRASVKLARPRKVRKRARIHGIVVRSKWGYLKRDGSSFKFFKNNITILKKRMTPRGVENFGPISFNIKRKKFLSSFSGIVF